MMFWGARNPGLFHARITDTLRTLLTKSDTSSRDHDSLRYENTGLDLTEGEKRLDGFQPPSEPSAPATPHLTNSPSPPLENPAATPGEDDGKAGN